MSFQPYEACYDIWGVWGTLSLRNKKKVEKSIAKIQHINESNYNCKKKSIEVLKNFMLTIKYSIKERFSESDKRFFSLLLLLNRKKFI